MVAAARRQLTGRYATGVDRLLWETEKRPMPDPDAVAAVIAAADHAEPLDIASALVLSQEARLSLDHLEHDLFEAARAAGITAAAIAAVLELPGETAVQARRRWLAKRRAMPYAQAGPFRSDAQDSPDGAADRPPAQIG
jgi:hypothetical protein